MANSTLVQINITSYGTGKPNLNESLTFNNTSSPAAYWAQYPFATGDNTLTAPTGAVAIMINNVTGTVKVKQSSGDAGFSFGTTYPAIFPIGATLLLNASAGAKADLLWI